MLFESVSELNGIGKFNQEIAVVKRISCSNLVSITKSEITTYFIVTSQKEVRQSSKKVFYV